MKTQGIAATVKGSRRENNEDRVYTDDDFGLYIVCDGMGGHEGGEVASRETEQTVVAFITSNRDSLEQARAGELPLSKVEELLDNAVQRACQHVFELGSENPQLKGMGSSVTLVLILGEHGIMAHVGDTRLYLYRDDAVHQLSRDHTIAAELARQGLIQEEHAHSHFLTHVLTQTVGQKQSVIPDTLVFDLLPGDKLLLCSDGLFPALKETEALIDVLDDSFEAIPQVLIKMAREIPI